MSLISKLPHNHKMKPSGDFRAELHDGHTQFVIFKCWCGKKQGFPDYNLQLALKNGTAETIRTLKKMGFKEVEN